MEYNGIRCSTPCGKQGALQMLSCKFSRNYKLYVKKLKLCITHKLACSRKGGHRSQDWPQYIGDSTSVNTYMTTTPVNTYQDVSIRALRDYCSPGWWQA